MMMLHPYLCIQETEGKGRGVFTTDALEADEIIEVAPVVVMSGEERTLLDATLLHDYIFEWGEQQELCALALGWVSVYNHAPLSNCEYLMDYETATIYIKTVRAVAANEELTINYNGEFNDAKPVWFPSIE